MGTCRAASISRSAVGALILNHSAPEPVNPPAVGVAGTLAAVVVWPSTGFCGVETVTRLPGPDSTGAPSGSGVSSAVTVTVTLGVVILKD